MVEQEFSTIYSRMNALMAHVGVYENLMNGTWTECVATTTKLENNMVNPNEENFAHEKFYEKF